MIFVKQKEQFYRELARFPEESGKGEKIKQGPNLLPNNLVGEHISQSFEMSGLLKSNWGHNTWKPKLLP